MRFTLLFPFAILAGFAAAAGPIARDADPNVADTGSSAVPDFTTVGAPARRSDLEVFARDIGDVSKREEFNPIEDRGDHDAILILCPTKNCHGKCFGYDIDKLSFKKCYEAKEKFKSVFILSKKSLKFGVYVANKKCRGVLVPKVNRCFEVEPFGKTFFKLEKRKHHSW